MTMQSPVTDPSPIGESSTFGKMDEHFCAPIGKRCFDVAVSIIMLVVFLPLSVAVALAIKIDSRGPVMFVQQRCGVRNTRFTMFKFRTMVDDADKILVEMMEKDSRFRSEYDAYHKVSNDPRITRVGKFLRKTSIDELPQLLNVLRGDMSIIGPRPYLPEEINGLGESRDAILSVKPGLTGLWQAERRNEATFSERIDMDVWYVANRSVSCDVKILIKTIPAVILRQGR